MITKILPSGAKLEIALAPFQDANNLQRAFARELKNVKISSAMEVSDVNFMKDLICTAVSSDSIMDALNVCMKRCAYNGLRIDKETFEAEEARGDFLIVCMEVAKENLLPFLKGLSAQFKDLLQGQTKK